MGYQRLVGLAVALAVILGGLLFVRSQVQKTSTHSLRLCTWSNYFPEANLKEFTTKTGIKVEVSFISSNEELFSKLKAGATGFDIIQPSDYMVRQLATLEMLAPLQHELVGNLKHLEDFYRNPPYDPLLRYSVPFTWGTTGIAVNTKKVPVPAEGIGWKFLFDSPDPSRTSLLDDMREVFSAVLMYQGEDPNTRDPEVLKKAQSEIRRIKDRILMFSSEPRSLLLREEVTIAHIFSLDAVQAHVDNPDIRYFVPKEGSVVWTDNFAIPKSSQKIREAHQFIDFFLDPVYALKLMRQNHLATPNRTVKASLSAEERQDPSLYPPAETLEKARFLDDIGETLMLLNRLWTELKS